jgi:hypothetical protein
MDPKRADSHAYAQELVAIIRGNNSELWISCDHVSISVLNQARAAVQQKTACLAFIPDRNSIQVLQNPRAFLKFAASQGLPVPESYEVKSRDDIHKVLHQSRGKRKYILSDSNGSTTARPRALLPQRTLSQTYDEVARIQILQSSQLRMDQAVEDGDRYHSTSIVVEGKLKAFAAARVEQEGTAYTTVPPSSALALAMHQWLTLFVAKFDAYTGHLSVEFSIDERPSASQTGVDKRILPIRASCGPSIPILQFHGIEGAIDLVRSYISIFGRRANGFIRGDDEVAAPVLNQDHDRGIYSLAADAYRLLIVPVLQLVTLRTNLFHVLGTALALGKHLCFWQEALYDFTDPLPCWYFYQIYVPVRLLAGALRGSRDALVDELREMTL